MGEKYSLPPQDLEQVCLKENEQCKIEKEPWSFFIVRFDDGILIYFLNVAVSCN